MQEAHALPPPSPPNPCQAFYTPPEGNLGDSTAAEEARIGSTGQEQGSGEKAAADQATAVAPARSKKQHCVVFPSLVPLFVSEADLVKGVGGILDTWGLRG